jgi:hypothetical protein
MDGFIVTASAQGRPGAGVGRRATLAGLRVETTRTVDGQTTGTVDLTDVVLPGDAVLAQRSRRLARRWYTRSHWRR